MTIRVAYRLCIEGETDEDTHSAEEAEDRVRAWLLAKVPSVGHGAALHLDINATVEELPDRDRGAGT